MRKNGMHFWVKSQYNSQTRSISDTHRKSTSADSLPLLLIFLVSCCYSQPTDKWLLFALNSFMSHVSLSLFPLVKFLLFTIYDDSNDGFACDWQQEVKRYYSGGNGIYKTKIKYSSKIESDHLASDYMIFRLLFLLLLLMLSNIESYWIELNWILDIQSKLVTIYFHWSQMKTLEMIFKRDETS